MPETDQNNKEIASEAMVDLARWLGLRTAIALIIGLAALQVLSWFPGIKDPWRVAIAMGVGASLTSVVVNLFNQGSRRGFRIGP
jgi:hypothetical protein